MQECVYQPSNSCSPNRTHTIHTCEGARILSMVRPRQTKPRGLHVSALIAGGRFLLVLGASRSMHPPALATYGRGKNLPVKKCHLGGQTTCNKLTCVSPPLYRLCIYPPNATTGHNLLAHVITFRLSHWGTLSELYSRCSDCIGAHNAMRHS